MPKTPKNKKTKKLEGRKTKRKVVIGAIKKSRGFDLSPSAAPERQFVVINETDPVAEAKIKAIWLVVIILGIGLLGFWFWTLKQNLAKPLNDEGLTNISQQFGQAFGDIKNVFKDTQNQINQALEQSAAQENLAKIKDDIIKQIQQNLNVNNWPSHTSEILGLSIQYPSDWQKQETNKALTFKIFNATSTAAQNLGQLIISKTANPQNISLTQWLADNKNKNKDNYLADDKPSSIDSQPAVRYTSQISGNNIDSLIFTSFNKNIYQISVAVKNGVNLYEPVVEQVLSTIKFIK